jgi:hypothetical protein
MTPVLQPERQKNFFISPKGFNNVRFFLFLHHLERCGKDGKSPKKRQKFLVFSSGEKNPCAF